MKNHLRPNSKINSKHLTKIIHIDTYTRTHTNAQVQAYTDTQKQMFQNISIQIKAYWIPTVQYYYQANPPPTSYNHCLWKKLSPIMHTHINSNTHTPSLYHKYTHMTYTGPVSFFFNIEHEERRIWLFGDYYLEFLCICQ